MPTTLWAQIWKQKYAPLTQENQLIRHNVRIQGSNIWNTAWKNRDLVQNHAFWEVQNGESAMFWQDSWQQLKPLSDLEELHPLKQALNQDTLLRVKDLWKPTDQRLQWHHWKTSNQELGVPEDLKPASLATLCKSPENPQSRRPRYSSMGTLHYWQLLSQRSLLPTRKLPESR
jgi:hypothetical protein